MPIKIIKAFQWSPNGYDVATVDAGEYESLPKRAGEIAAQIGALYLPNGTELVTVETTSAALPVEPPAVDMAQGAAVASPQNEVIPEVPAQHGGEKPDVSAASQTEPVRRRNRRAPGASNG